MGVPEASGTGSGGEVQAAEAGDVRGRGGMEVVEARGAVVIAGYRSWEGTGVMRETTERVLRH